MNLSVASPKNTALFLLAGLLIFAGKTAARENPVRERKVKPVEIQAESQRRTEEARETKPVAEIREKETRLPEIPKPITRGQLGPAEQVRLAELERKRAAGTITETEYELEKDTLFREANITF